MSSRFDSFLEAYRQTIFEFGVADIFTDDSPDVAGRTGSFVLLMNQAKIGKDENHVHGILVIAPPSDSNLGCDQAEIERASRKAAETLFQRELSEQEQASIGRFVRVVHSKNYDIESVIHALQTADEGSAAVVLYAALYRMPAQQDIPPLPSIPLPDDLWVPHLCVLAARAVTIAKSRNFYLLLDTGEAAPQRPENYERLKGIDGCGLFGMYSKHDGGKLLADNIANWRSLAEAGRLGSAFASIDSLPSWMDSQKSFLKLQLMESVTPGEEILRILREDAHIRTKADYRARLKLARIAERANDDDLSLELLTSSIDELRSEEEYLLAAGLADDLAEFALLERILDRADVLFPSSSRLFDLRLRMYLRCRRYAELVKRVLDSTVPIEPQRRFFFLTLGSAFASEGPVDFDLLLNAVTSATPQFTSWCQVVCANEAIERQDFLQSIHLCMPIERRPLTMSIASVLIAALRRLLLQRQLDGKNLMIKGDDMVPPVQAVIAYLSSNPRDAATRQRLTSLVSVETSGLLGFAVLVAITDRLSATTTVKTRVVSPAQPMTTEDEDATLEVVKNIMDWSAKESPLIPGRTVVPKDLLRVPPDEVMLLVRHALKHGSDLRVKVEEETFDKIMAVGLIIAPLTTDPDEDLDLLRYAGARYIAANKAQKARDLAEQALNTAANTPIRKRLAWIAFSDIYHRAHSFNEALLGIACALSINIPVDYEQLYQEGSLLVRIYRDIKFITEAQRLADRLLVLCSELNLDKAYGQRIKTLLLHIRMMKVFGHPETLMEELPDLIQDAAQHCLELVEEGEETSPAVMILAQSIQRGIAAGIEVSEAANKVLRDRLAGTPHPIVDMLKLMDNSATTGSELLTFAQSIQAARNAEDIAFDLMMLGIATRRFLDSAIDSGDVGTAAFCIEALTDHAFRNALVGTERSPFQEKERSVNMARDLSLRGIDILMVGLSERGILVRLRVTEGVADLEKESSDVFSGSKFLAWSEKYPYGYAQVTEAMNLFYVTLTGIGISLVPTRPTLLVMDNSLQQMPPNLIMSGDNFAGRQVPMAAAPSLSWAWEMSSRTFSTTKKVAWISTEYADDKNPALIMVAERLDETLKTNEITLHTSAAVPNDLAEAEIAIIAAHGSILPEGRYVQRISDDADLTLYPAVLANAVRGSAIVILFVCSGGRFDTHPVAETTVGLVRELLDQGCSTVIASPWPLDTRVPSHWLPTFLERWNSGETAICASFAANQNVMKQMGDSPLESLAMNVFGDPLRTKPS
jgi:tetratricopeptide (TPR) repeat protein